MGIFQRRFIYLFFFENTAIISYFMKMQNFFLQTAPQVPITEKAPYRGLFLLVERLGFTHQILVVIT